MTDFTEAPTLGAVLEELRYGPVVAYRARGKQGGVICAECAYFVCATQRYLAGTFRNARSVEAARAELLAFADVTGAKLIPDYLEVPSGYHDCVRCGETIAAPCAPEVE